MVKEKTLNLFCPHDYKTLSKEELNKITNGCGPQGWKFDFVPDKIWGLCINLPCRIHDYMYHIGKGIKDKEEADRVFLNNMIRLIEYKTKWKWLKWLRKRRAYKYYVAVKYLGGPAFWVNKNNSNHIFNF